MNQSYKLITAVVFMFVLCVCGLNISEAQAQRINQIRIEGAERIDPSTIMTYLEIQSGDEFNTYSMNKSIKTLYATGLFADVLLYQQGNDLVVKVVENPIINEIAFEGNEKIKDENLLSEVSLRPRTVLTRTKVQADTERLLDIYRLSGRFAAKVEPKVIKLDQNRVNLVFEIDEGPETRIRKVNIIGNEYFSDGQLESVISSKESRWYRFLTSNDKYDPDRLAYDAELLRRHYLNHGFADIQVESSTAELSPDQKDFFLTFIVSEGERYKVNNIEIVSRIPELSGNQLVDAITFEKGDWYNAEEVERTIVELTEKAGNLQYAFVDIRPSVNRDRDNNLIDITFTVNESRKVFVERIDINGNVRTLDEVIRREFTLVEGDAYNRTKMTKSEQNIRNLDFFETVSVEERPGSTPDKTIVDVNVQEKSTGELSIGAGFSTQDGPLAEFRIREKNLLGRGQELAFSTTIAGERTEFDLSFTEPYFLKRDLSAGIDLFRITRDQDELAYDLNRTGGGLRLGYPVAKDLRQTLGYRLEQNDIQDVDPAASFFIRAQEGERTTSAISQQLVYDTRDSILDPTEGLVTRFTTEVAGLGGDAQYVQNRIGANYFYPIRDQWIFSVLGEGGYIFGYGDEDVQVNERFYLGGNTLRGFERSGVGPRDVATDDSLGGNTFYRGSVELAMPSGLPEDLGVRAHVFSDFGSLWNVDDSGATVEDENSLRLSVGAGLSWRSPLGPLRVDFATPILDEEYDVDEVFRFSFGTSF